jgi:DNA-binding response OmpR family regulator
VLSSLKAEPEVSAIPVIVVSVLGERSLAMSVGACDYVTKPVDRADLARVLRTHLE